MKAKRALIIPDCHIPYEDKRAYQLMLDVAVDIDPDEVIILGDFADFYGINAHGKDPSISETLQDELFEVRQRLSELKRLFPKAKRVFIEGNHCYRLARYIGRVCPDLYGMVTVESLLELKCYGFKFVPYGPNQQYSVLGSTLIARHEPLAGGMHHAASTARKAMKSVIYGHTHQIQENQVVAIDGENYRAISSGWLGDKYHPVFNYVKNHHQWALGFSVVTSIGGTWFNQLVHIINYKCVCDGFIYEG